MRYLFIGRFQPLHLGHYHVMKSIQNRGKLIVGIGSSNVRDKRNPFSAETRKKMVRALFPDAEIHLIPDFPSDSEWVEWILDNISFDVVITGNNHVWECFEGVKPLERIEMFHPDKYSGTRIRELMRRNVGWEELVPDACRLIIMNSEGYRRLAG